jgi:hypothetical protein
VKTTFWLVVGRCVGGGRVDVAEVGGEAGVDWFEVFLDRVER